jgi:hypothetical protein
MQKSCIKWDSLQPLKKQLFNALPQCITEIIHHSFKSEKLFDLGIPKDMEKVQHYGHSDVLDRTIAMSTERAFISRETRMIQDLEDLLQEIIRKL